MDYELKHGSSEVLLTQQALKNDEELPDFIKNKPYLLDDSLHFYMQAFFVLESERNIGFGIGSIPITKIIEYGKFLGYTNENIHNFVYFMRELDLTALNYYNSKNKNKK